MATVVVSGRIDEAVKAQADRYLKAAGMSVADLIRTTWENVAATGEVPTPVADPALTAHERWEKFMEFCDSMPPADPRYAELTDEQFKDLRVSRYA